MKRVLYVDDKITAVYWYSGRDIFLFLRTRLHSIFDMPAVVKYNEVGRVTYEQWCRHGARHRILDHKPAVIYYDANGEPTYQAWYRYNKLYRENGLPTEEGDSSIDKDKSYYMKKCE